MQRLAAMAGGVLKLHPKIVVENGKMLPKNKYRGKMNKVLLEYVKEMEMDLRHAKKERVFITHSGCDAETIQQIYDYLKNLNIFQEIVYHKSWRCYF